MFHPSLFIWLREEHMLRVLENRVMRKIFGPKREDVTWGAEDYITRKFMVCTLDQILFS
jgi:hypothetical protein